MGRESKDDAFVLPSPSEPLGTPHQVTHGAAQHSPAEEGSRAGWPGSRTLGT